MRVYSKREGQVGIVVPYSTTSHRYTKEALILKVIYLNINLLTTLGRLNRK
jgi:hypothetical protein